MKSLIHIIFLMSIVPATAQDFITEIYFEDAQGRLDTLTLGDIKSGANFDMFDIQEEPIGDFDVRLIRYTRASPNDPIYLYGDCDHEAGEISLTDPDFINDIDFETKALYSRAVNCNQATFGGLSYEFIIPIDASFPVSITWDNIPYQDSCRSRSFISEVPFPFVFEDFLFCEDRINHPRVSLSETNSVTLEEPNFLTFERSDGTIVSVYYIHLASTSFTGDIIDNVNKVADTNLDLHPNPVQDKLYLETIEQNWNYTIQNLHGQQMMNGVYQDEVDVAQLPSGIYFLQLQREEDYFKAIKFVKK